MSTAHKIELPLGPSFEEHAAWSLHVRSWLQHLPDNVLRICQYGFLEMANNANDHSGSTEVVIAADISAEKVRLTVEDFGIGIFAKIKAACSLEDERIAILELTKGKLTTDPQRHTGEGIFFCSRMFDEFSIYSRGLCLIYDQQKDWLADIRKTDSPTTGTCCEMEIETSSTRTAKEVFDRYASDRNDYGFRQTTVAVRLAQSEGSALLSRSHARRILARLENFREAVLDFGGVSEITPAFADEIFRVWRKAHPGTELKPMDANEDVQRMIARAIAAR